jgi:hypothetical protein
MLTEVEFHPFELMVHPLMGIPWMVHWWVLVHSGCLKLVLNYKSRDGFHLGCWAKTGDESNSQDENSNKEGAWRRKKRGPNWNWFSHPSWFSLTQVLPPSFLDFAIPVVPSLLLVFFIKSSLCKILQIFLVNWHPVCPTWPHSNWGWNKVYGVKIGCKYKATLKDNFNGLDI